jgi:glycosyltransferase involved in cell wall biosynthesis
MIAPVKPPRKSLDHALISVVLPLYNEQAAIERLVELIDEALLACGCRYEIVFVNDGSMDGSGEKLDMIAASRGEIHVVHFSRNFGHQAALQAGLEHATGDAVIVMDSDLQDNPASIRDFLREWQNGFDVVYAERVKRKEGLIKRALFYSFYRVLNLISTTPIPTDAGNFGLLDRAVVNCVNGLSDRDRYFPGLRRWVGFRQTGVIVEREARYDDHPRVSLVGLFRLAKSAVFSFSSFPLTMFYGIAAVSAFVCAGCIGFVMYHRFITGWAIPGWTSMIMTASFFGALNALGISILGEYVIRIYDQVRARPPYVVARRVNCSDIVKQDSMLEWVDRQIVEDAGISV